MNRKDFGELIAALRQDLSWTQFQLAEYSSLDVSVISQIERGVKKFFEPELLFSLANAFQLTTLERHEFFFAANGLNENQIVRQPSGALATDVFDAKKVVARLISLIGEMRCPAYLADVYGDLVAANHMMREFYSIPEAYIEAMAGIPGGYNTIRVDFGRERFSRLQVTDNWDAYALMAIHTFKANTLCYRAWPYFKYLIKIFRNPSEYPFFDRYWKLASSMEWDKEFNLDHFAYSHNRFGPINYIASVTPVSTSFGKLFLVHNIPLDQKTESVFDDLKRQAGQGVVRLAPWPEKPIP